MKVPTERLREMLAACEGVTLGPWQTIRSLMPCDGEYDFAISASAAKVLSEAFGRAADGKVLPAEQNAAHIANCDPATIRSALSELLELREAVKAAPSPPIGDTGGVGEAPAAWQHRGPRGGWITTDEKMQWSERALYLRPVPARVEAVEPRVSDTGWLIECKPSVSRTPQWFHLEEEWVTDASKALRFARKQDAESFIEHTGWTETFASEHMWSDPK